MKNVISTIIPVYNVDKYLEQCLDSVLSQSYQLLEVILIDDGSTDLSPEICEKYAKKDSRVKVVHKKNGGAASAKNVGLRMATGEYLSFVDSDDILEPDAYNKFILALNNSGADVAQGSYCKLFTNGKENVYQKPLVESGEQFLLRFTKEWSCGLLWDKLYRKELFEGIFFLEGNIIDDEFFTYRGIMNATKVVRIPDVVYQYRQRKSSVMMSKDSRERIVLDKIQYLQMRRKVVTDKFPALACAYDEHYLNMLIILAYDANSSSDSILEIKKALKLYFKGKHEYLPPFTMRLKIIGIQHMGVNELLRKKNTKDTKVELERFFP